MNHSTHTILLTAFLSSALVVTAVGCQATVNSSNAFENGAPARADMQPETQSKTLSQTNPDVFVHEDTSSYTSITLHGFTVLVSQSAMNHPETTDPAIKLLGAELKEVLELTPVHTHNDLRAVRFWLEHFNPGFPCACYHPGAQWLDENGYNTDKVGGIEITNAAHFVEWASRDQPLMVLHELAHAYHDQVLGFSNKQIAGSYENAESMGTYESVTHVSGESRRHYGLNNDREYFAELTESYFGKNDFQPFTRDELARFDPQGLQMIEELWGTEREATSVQD
jgi:hypothetical protein